MYIVLEDYFELHESSFEGVFHRAFHLESDAQSYVRLLNSKKIDDYSTFYYIEIEIY